MRKWWQWFREEENPSKHVIEWAELCRNWVSTLMKTLQGTMRREHTSEMSHQGVQRLHGFPSDSPSMNCGLLQRTLTTYTYFWVALVCRGQAQWYGRKPSGRERNAGAWGGNILETIYHHHKWTQMGTVGIAGSSNSVCCSQQTHKIWIWRERNGYLERKTLLYMKQEAKTWGMVL